MAKNQRVASKNGENTASKKIHNQVPQFQVLGASMRNPARGKGHEEGSLTKCKGVIRLQGFPLEFPEHPPPKTRVCLPYCAVLSTLLTLQGAIPDHLSLKEFNLELWSPGHNRVFQSKPL